MSPVGTLGGAERVLLELIRLWAHRRDINSVQVVCLDEGPLVRLIREFGIFVLIKKLPERLSRLGDNQTKGRSFLVQFLRLVLAGPSIFFVVIKWKKFLRQISPNWIHSNGLKTHLLSAWSAPKDVPIFWHLHDFIGERPLMRRLLTLAWRPGIRGIAISKAVADDYSKYLPKCPLDIIYNTIDCKKFRPEKIDGGWLDVASKLAEGYCGYRVGLVATYARWKGHDIFLEACSRLVSKFNDKIRFYIVGGPVYQTTGSQWSLTELQDLIKKHGLLENVGLVPFQEDASMVYQSLDIVIHASVRPEPFGLVIGEAMACGRPVIAALHGGAAEIGIDGVDYIGHQPGDPDSLSNAIEDLILDEGKRIFLSINARKRILDKFQ